MATGVLIIAEPGSGKSTAISTLDPKTTFIINVSGKDLPFRGWKKLYTPLNSKEKTGNYYEGADAATILKVIEFVNKEMPWILTIVIDDTNYVSSFEFIKRSNEKGYEKFNIMAKNAFDIFTIPKSLRSDLTVFYTNHPEVFENAEGINRIKARTIGKLLDEKIVIEGLFTIVLYGRARRSGKETKYFFETQTDGITPAKSPREMFTDFEIPNDLEFVRQSIISYND